MVIFPLSSAAAAVLVTILFASPSPSPKPSPSVSTGPGLTPAVEARDLAELLSAQGRHEDAIMHYEDAIWFGRSAILKDQKEKDDHETNENGDASPIIFLVSLYRSSALNRLAIPDLDGARTEAWAACVHAQSLGAAAAESSANGGFVAKIDEVAIESEVSAQVVLAAVCRAGDDPFGESQAWKRILELTAGDDSNHDEDRWVELPGIEGVEGDKELPLKRESIEMRLRDLEKELKEKFGVQ